MSVPPLKGALEAGLQDGSIRPEQLGRDEREPAGPLAAYLGPRFSIEQVRSAEDYVEDERVQEFVRAYPVPGLADVEVEAADDGAAFASALATTLRAHLPWPEWTVERDLSGPLRKYALLHTSLNAPIDEATNQPMALELCGALLTVGGAALPESGSDEWFRRDRDLDTPLPGPITVRIHLAVYANVAYPGIGMPFYI